MFLQSLSLENIRSYTKASLDFPEGKTLLSGDVGSGKTTILLAIEFALFGILRGELSAASLLRHGENEGSVTLHFSIDDQQYKLLRTLKRDGKSVKQGNGSLNEESLTPVELKSRVLTILGYSQDLLTKAKSLVFRYTVYTPQEAMKHILFEDSDARLETLRKVFGIDQYKQVQSNTNVLLRELRSEEKAHTLQLEELPHKEQERKQAEQLLSSQKEEQERVGKEKARQQELFTITEEKYLSLKKQADRYHEAKREHSIITTHITRLEQRQTQILDVQEREEKELVRLKNEEKEDVVSLKEKLLKKEGQTTIIEERLLKARQRQATLQANIAQTNQAKEKLDGLASTCPLCQQAVPHTHKDALLQQQTISLEKNTKQLDEINKFIEQATEKKTLMEEQVNRIRANILKASQQEERVKNKEEQQEKTVKELAKIREELVIRKEKEHSVKEELITVEHHFKKYEEQEKVLNKEREVLNDIKIKEASIKATITAAVHQLAATTKALKRLKQHKERASVLQRHNHWLKESFLPLTDKIEKTVFSSLHQEFTLLFSNWFDQIIEDDTLQVRLDQEFSPIIELNGYETEVQALSGGEKTAVALAYRLSLNQVINEFLGTINTRDLLILDEPTDGFSSYQLDRMREVLNQLRIKQLIIVSHEQQVEGFVEHVIHVRKESHVSSIEQ